MGKRRTGGDGGTGVSAPRRPSRIRRAGRWVGYRTPRRELPLEPGLILYQPPKAAHVGCEYETWILIGFLNDRDSDFGHRCSKNHHLLPYPSCALSCSYDAPRACWLPHQSIQPRRFQRLYVYLQLEMAFS